MLYKSPALLDALLRVYASYQSRLMRKAQNCGLQLPDILDAHRLNTKEAKFTKPFLNFPAKCV